MSDLKITNKHFSITFKTYPSNIISLYQLILSRLWSSRYTGRVNATTILLFQTVSSRRRIFSVNKSIPENIYSVCVGYFKLFAGTDDIAIYIILKIFTLPLLVIDIHSSTNIKCPAYIEVSNILDAISDYHFNLIHIEITKFNIVTYILPLRSAIRPVGRGRSEAGVEPW